MPDDPGLPFFVEGVGGALFQLVGPGGIEHPHEYVPVNHGLQGLGQHGHCHFEARVGLHAVQVDGDHRHLRHPCLFQSPADKSDIVGGTAAAAGLGHEDGGLVQVVFSGQQGVHDLTDDDQGGVAGIVVDVFQTGVDGGPVVVLKHLHMVPEGIQGRLQKVEVNRRHLGAQQGIVLFHLLGEHLTVVGRRVLFPGEMMGLPHPQGRDQGPDADPCGSQVIDLVDLQHRIDLAGARQDVADLIRGNGVQAAAEGIELHQIQVIPGLYKGGGPVQAGVVHPLVRDDDGPFHLSQMGNGILRQHRKTVAGDHVRDTMVDLGIDVIGAARQHDAVMAGLFHPGKDLLSFFLRVRFCLQKLLPGQMGGGTDLRLRKSWNLSAVFRQAVLAEFCQEFLHEPICQHLFIGKGEEGIHEVDMVVVEAFHVVFDVLRIGGDHGAVIVVACIRGFVPLIGDAGVEDPLYPVFDQPFDVSVHQLCRVAFGL